MPKKTAFCEVRNDLAGPLKKRFFQNIKIIEWKNLKEEIKNRIKLSEIISKKVILKKKSENSFIGLCPFHSEKTPSFHVHDEKQFYHCFGCEKHGDIFSFTMELDNLDFYNDPLISFLFTFVFLFLVIYDHLPITLIR